MKILLFGRDGQVGWELQRSLSVLGELCVSGRTGKFAADFSEPDTLTKVIYETQPNLIVNAAAYTAVDHAEEDNEGAYAINSLAPSVIASAASNIKAFFVHYSTDYVFDGTGKTPWSEEDHADPRCVYGRTKLEGENAIIQSGVDHIILRTSWVYGFRGKNFPKTVINLLQERETLEIVDDQIGVPTNAGLIADVTGHILRLAYTDASARGIFHLVPNGQTSWYGIADYIRKKVSVIRPDLMLKTNKIVPVSSEKFPTPALRPLNSRLNTKKLETKFHLRLPDWKFDMDRFLIELIGNSKS